MNRKADLSWEKLAVWVILIVFVLLVFVFLNAQFSTGSEDGIFRKFADTLFGEWNSPPAE